MATPAKPIPRTRPAVSGTISIFRDGTISVSSRKISIFRPLHLERCPLAHCVAGAPVPAYHGYRSRWPYQYQLDIARWIPRQVSLCLNGIAVGRTIRHLAFVLEHDAGDEHMVLQILANPGQVLDDINSKAAKGHRFPYA